MIKLFACAVGLFFTTSTLAATPILEFKGICDASAAVALDEKRIIVGDDEKPWLSVYDLETRQSESPIPLPVLTATSGRSEDPPEADIEAATILGDQIVWISSHGRNKNGKVRSSRFQLFASHRLSVDGATWERSFSRSFQGLLADIRVSSDPDYEPLRKAIGDLDNPDPALAPKKNGFNIEAMTADREGRTLLIGLRNPQSQGGAILFQIMNPQDLLSGRADHAALGPVTKLDLGGRGFRDVGWSPIHQAYLIVAGQADDEQIGPGFAIFKWTGSGKPVAIDAFGDVNHALPHFHPEAIVPLKERTGQSLVYSKQVLLISDDGTRPIIGEGECKTASEGKKSFRGVVTAVP